MGSGRVGDWGRAFKAHVAGLSKVPGHGDTRARLERQLREELGREPKFTELVRARLAELSEDRP
jgi:hypothetical protein